jgi:hypothetical protein
MSRVWGRDETYRWPSDKPVWTITALALTVVAVLAAAGMSTRGNGPTFSKRIWEPTSAAKCGCGRRPRRLSWRIESRANKSGRSQEK